MLFAATASSRLKAATSKYPRAREYPFV